ncbi:signal transduction protein [Luminiphilus syltensis NOR5-1B]|uniref:Signal transduction protein n=1 Tax=Luminiphilus syltensis NOR5-1B TaxID=565045 RepID=B8KXC0_9GAMM|nr:EAL domain-containing protein [Luminiphilus syltensis]EED36507.1 signal transduction protein [Luminiphilus syltensis NOR5-1B]
MKVSDRFTVFSLLVALLAGAVVLATLLQWEFSARKKLLLAQVEINIASTSYWPDIVHFRKQSAAAKELKWLLHYIEETTSAAVFHVDGGLIAKTSRNLLAPFDNATLSRPEQNDPTDTLVLSIEGTQNSNELSTWISLLPGAKQILAISVPISTTINPLDERITEKDYREQLAVDGGDGARFVAGYVEAAIPVSAIYAGMQQTASLLTGGVAVSILILFLLVKILSRSISKPLELLAETADRISTGQLPEQIKIRRGRHDEIAHIATVLNGVIDGVHKFKTQLNADKNLLTLRMDSQSKQLDQAQEEVNETQQKLQRAANYDALTDLPNRQLMTEQLNTLMRIAERERKHVGLVFVDLDNLRRINETLGREIGDQVLRQFSKRLVTATRNSDVVGRNGDNRDVSRVGTDEFSIVLHGIENSEDVHTTARRILDELNHPLDVDGQILPMQCVMGFAVAPQHGRKPQDLMRAADIALTHAKNERSRTPEIYNLKIDQAGSIRFQLEGELRAADFDAELQLHYQPQIDTEKGTVVGAEALLRWDNPNRGMVPPFQFIPIAEDSGIIIEIGDWIIRKACEDFQTFERAGVAPPKISVNVSALQLSDRFIDLVAETLRQTAMDPARFELELTESSLVADVDGTLAKLQRLHSEVGVRLSVDDFGTGYSSLAYLAKFPLNELKVDRSFVVAMENDANSAKVTGAIIAMARELELEIVAEGVDNPNQFKMLQDFGAHVIQGFIFSKPLDPEYFQEFSRERPFLALLQDLTK